MKKIIVYLLIVAVLVGAAWMLVTAPREAASNAAHGVHSAEAVVTKGPHGGRLLTDGEFAIELTIFEDGVPPEFHIYSYVDSKPLPPGDVEVTVTLSRLDGQVDAFRFSPRDDYLRGDGVVVEPHSFDVEVNASYQQRTHRWQYANYEGRVAFSRDFADQSGIVTEKAGPVKLKQSLELTGRVQTDPNRLSVVRARYPGVVTQLKHDIGDRVQAGDVLATIQSNDSLQIYTLKSPVAGVVIQRDAFVGKLTADDVLFTVVDLSRVWIELDVFDKDLALLRVGQVAVVETLSGSSARGKIDWISPLAAHASQSFQARVTVQNRDEQFRPGQFVRGRVTVAERAVPLAVRKSGVQSFRDFQVVFARIGDTYEVRMLELGGSDSEWIEVLGGLKAGTEYVTENSYLIKADIEKSGASHDH